MAEREFTNDENDENTLLMTEFNQEGREQRPEIPTPKTRRSRSRIGIFAAVITAAIVGVLLFFSLLQSKRTATSNADFLVEETSRTREYHWTISKVTGAPVGVSKPVVVVNGQSPGPLIEANWNDRIIVHVTNAMDDATSIHWHGLYQNGTNHYDGTTGVTQCGIPPGQTLVYDFKLDGFYGTTWYHGHTDLQEVDGLYGAIVIHKLEENVPSYDHENILMLSDIYNTWSTYLLDQYLNANGRELTPEPVPDTAAINGIGQFSACYAFPEQACTGGSYFNLTVELGKTYRLRLINTGAFASIRFSVDSHLLTVIEADGTPVKPLKVSELMIQPAQRYSVLLTANTTPEAYWMRGVMDQRMFADTNMHIQPEVLGVLRYSSVSADNLPAHQSRSSLSRSNIEARILDVEDLVPADAIDAPATADLTIPWIFSIQRTFVPNWRSFINHTAYEALPRGENSLMRNTALGDIDGTRVWPGDQLIARIDGVKTVDFIINNLDDGDHPFHLHGYKPWIVGRGKGRYTGSPLNATNPMRRDTYNVPRFSWMALRIVTDTPGYWAFHCHIAWHMAAGGLFQVAVQPTRLSEIELPKDVVEQCQYWNTLDADER
ncbi:multicopper oxidase [Cylindrobasidium torrendii FP15055 ss-10]|uniref:Multicopper oxidase n=1 Tax=Cylindrobasidium torrendii FP15055 ss-10 TaxID=1314674 RepID=A0A0D7B491_9AGAR|nr:multicopper oxidase [Cylindrobasidium torrendii FP15055 ss-10]